jgi:hypothetical protein
MPLVLSFNANSIYDSLTYELLSIVIHHTSPKRFYTGWTLRALGIQSSRAIKIILLEVIAA